MIYLTLSLVLIAGPAARATVWLDHEQPSVRQSCSDPIGIAALSKALDGSELDVFRTLRLEYLSGPSAHEVDLEVGTSVRFKLRRFNLSRDRSTNVVSMFARKTSAAGVWDADFEAYVLALSRAQTVFEPLINDAQAPHVDLNDWVQMRGLKRFREVLGHDFVRDVNEDITSYLQDSRTIHHWDRARAVPLLKRRYADLLGAPFLVFALDSVSLILAANLKQVAVCVAREGKVNWPHVGRTVAAWLADPGVKRMLTCEAALLR